MDDQLMQDALAAAGSHGAERLGKGFDMSEIRYG